jgi:hypothetical protein
MTAGQAGLWAVITALVIAIAARVAFLEGRARVKAEAAAADTTADDHAIDDAFKAGEEAERWRAVAVVERLLAAAPSSVVGRAILRELGGVVPPRARKVAEPAPVEVAD